MSRFHEMRLEVTRLEDGQSHLALFSTDSMGQWFLVDDWTTDNTAGYDVAAGEALNLIDGWIQTGLKVGLA